MNINMIERRVFIAIIDAQCKSKWAYVYVTFSYIIDLYEIWHSVGWILNVIFLLQLFVLRIWICLLWGIFSICHNIIIKFERQQGHKILNKLCSFWAPNIFIIIWSDEMFRYSIHTISKYQFVRNCNKCLNVRTSSPCHFMRQLLICQRHVVKHEKKQKIH